MGRPDFFPLSTKYTTLTTVDFSLRRPAVGLTLQRSPCHKWKIQPVCKVQGYMEDVACVCTGTPRSEAKKLALEGEDVVLLAPLI